MTVSAVARLQDISPSLPVGWRRRMSEGGFEAVRADEDVVPASRLREAGAEVREPGHRRRGPCHCRGDDEPPTAIRAVTDGRPTSGTRRVTAPLDRDRRGADIPPVNGRRVLRLMRQASLTLQPCTGRRIGRTHEGTSISPASDQRWASDGLAIRCRTGDTVHVALAIDARDRDRESFVKTLKRDHVRVSPCPHPRVVPRHLPAWLEDHDTIHSHSGWRRLPSRELIAQRSSTPAACPV